MVGFIHLPDREIIMKFIEQFENVLGQGKLYEITDDEIDRLLASSDQFLVNEIKTIWLPLIMQARREKKEVQNFNGKMKLAYALPSDKESIMQLSSLCYFTNECDDLNLYTPEYFDHRLKSGKILLVKTESNYLVGFSDFKMVKQENGQCITYDWTLLVRKLFRRKKIAFQLVDEVVTWLRKNNISSINISGFSDDGYAFIHAYLAEHPELSLSGSRFLLSTLTLDSQ